MNPRPPQRRATLEQRFESVLIQATRALAGERGLKVACAAPGASASGPFNFPMTISLPDLPDGHLTAAGNRLIAELRKNPITGYEKP